MSNERVITITGDPISKKNHRPIFRNRRTGTPFLGKSKTLAEAERTAISYCLHSGIKPTSQDVEVAFKFYCSTRRRVDLSNAVQLYEDALQSAGILENDKQIRSLDGTRQYHDPERPRIEIHISDFVE